MNLPGLSHAKVMTAIRRLAQGVMPHFSIRQQYRGPGETKLPGRFTQFKGHKQALRIFTDTFHPLGVSSGYD
jgi:hypothetical protein